MTTPTEAPIWHTPSFAEFNDANPNMLNHSSRLVVDPEVPVSVNPEPSPPTPPG